MNKIFHYKLIQDKFLDLNIGFLLFNSCDSKITFKIIDENNFQKLSISKPDFESMFSQIKELFDKAMNLKIKSLDDFNLFVMTCKDFKNRFVFSETQYFFIKEEQKAIDFVFDNFVLNIFRG